MNCKYCNSELVEGKPFCPSCGKAQTEAAEEVAETVTEEAAVVEETLEPTTQENASEEKPLPFETAYEQPAETEIKEGIKATPGKIAMAVVAGIVVLAILVALIVSGLGGVAKEADHTIAPTSGVLEATEEVVPVTIPSNGDPESNLCKETYTVTDEEAAAARDVVVATMGEKELTNGELQAYYWMEVSLFLQEYGSYAEYFGLDLYTPFDQQVSEMGETPMSWQQYFLDCATYSWKVYQSMELEAEEAGYVLPEERQAELEALPADLEETALSAGMASVDELVAENIGPGAKLEDYIKYVETYYNGMSYYYDLCDALNPTDEEVEAFFAENETYYAENGMTKETKYVNVRHVLLQPEGGETGEDGYPIFTDEAWAACLQQAEEIYNNWLEGDQSEDSFAQLAMDYSVDGNASTGGLYEDVYEGQMVEEFESWCFDAARQVGDHGLVKTAYGYHIMFFSGSRNPWFEQAKSDLISELANDMIPAAIDKYDYTIDYSKMVLGEVNYVG